MDSPTLGSTRRVPPPEDTICAPPTSPGIIYANQPMSYAVKRLKQIWGPGKYFVRWALGGGSNFLPALDFRLRSSLKAPSRTERVRVRGLRCLCLSEVDECQLRGERQ